MGALPSTPDPKLPQPRSTPMLPENVQESTLVLYNLRDPKQWSRAYDQRKTYGGRAITHRLDNDHVVLELPADYSQERTA